MGDDLSIVVKLWLLVKFAFGRTRQIDNPRAADGLTTDSGAEGLMKLAPCCEHFEPCGLRIHRASPTPGSERTRDQFRLREMLFCRLTLSPLRRTRRIAAPWREGW